MVGKTELHIDSNHFKWCFALEEIGGKANKQ